jgi:hypothetical protein
MSSPSHIDDDWQHLFPPFAAKLRQVLEETGVATQEEWVLVEGYRSVARQAWLYASGRTRPGPVITWMKTPRFHGTGVAADCRPARVAREGYDAIPGNHWAKYRSTYHAHGLENPAWGKGDLQHVQWSDRSIVAKGTAWAKAGFPRQEEAPGVPIHVAGTLIRTRGFLDDQDRAWVPVRVVYVAMPLPWQSERRIEKIERAGDHLEIELVWGAVSRRVPVTLHGGAGHVRAIDLLKAWGLKADWRSGAVYLEVAS